LLSFGSHEGTKITKITMKQEATLVLFVIFVPSCAKF